MCGQACLWTCKRIRASAWSCPRRTGRLMSMRTAPWCASAVTAPLAAPGPPAEPSKLHPSHFSPAAYSHPPSFSTSLTHSPTHSFTHFAQSLTHSPTHTLSHSLACSLTQSLIVFNHNSLSQPSIRPSLPVRGCLPSRCSVVNCLQAGVLLICASLVPP